jgi:hypothetical protein
MFSGAPVTVYVVVPVERLEILSKLLRIWIGTLLHSAFKSTSGGSWNLVARPGPENFERAHPPGAAGHNRSLAGSAT